MAWIVYSDLVKTVLRIEATEPQKDVGVSYFFDADILKFPTPPHKDCILKFLDGVCSWEDPRTLQEIKTAKWTEIKQARSQAEYAGFTWDGSVFDSDALSQQRITGAVTLAQMDAEFSIDWTLADNTVRPLNAAQMKEVGTALGVHVATQFAHAQDLRVQLDAAQTPEEVAALGW
jgi:hypothetical protein